MVSIFASGPGCPRFDSYGVSKIIPFLMYLVPIILHQPGVNHDTCNTYGCNCKSAGILYIMYTSIGQYLDGKPLQNPLFKQQCCVEVSRQIWATSLVEESLTIKLFGFPFLQRNIKIKSAEPHYSPRKEMIAFFQRYFSLI